VKFYEFNFVRYFVDLGIFEIFESHFLPNLYNLSVEEFCKLFFVEFFE
jgi:hypothetical protein